MSINLAHRTRNILDDLSDLIIYLPETEQNLIMYVKQGIPQREIAKILGVTQGAVSSRQKRATQRLLFLKEVQKFKFDTMAEDLAPHFTSFEIELLRIMSETTCQSETARLLNDKHNLFGDKKMTQVKVKYRFEKAIVFVKGLCDKVQTDPALLKKYHKMHRFLMLIKNNLYKLHEVKLPHFGG